MSRGDFTLLLHPGSHAITSRFETWKSYNQHNHARKTLVTLSSIQECHPVQEESWGLGLPLLAIQTIGSLQRVSFHLFICNFNRPWLFEPPWYVLQFYKIWGALIESQNILTSPPSKNKQSLLSPWKAQDKKWQKDTVLLNWFLSLS